HLQGHQPAEFVLTAIESLRGFAHPRGALGEGASSIPAKGLDGSLQLLLDFRLIKSLEGAYGFSGGRINGCDRHVHSSLCYSPPASNRSVQPTNSRKESRMSHAKTMRFVALLLLVLLLLPPVLPQSSNEPTPATSTEETAVALPTASV